MKKYIILIIAGLLVIGIFILCIMAMMITSHLANICGFIGFMFAIMLSVEVLYKTILKDFDANRRS